MTENEIDDALTRLGYEGSYEDAVRAFQKAWRLKVDGDPGIVTQEALKKALMGHKATASKPVTVKPGALPFSVGKITRPITGIVIHCTATQAGREFTRAQIKAMHLARGFTDIGYHAIQHLDGTWEMGRAWNTVGAHVANHNTGTLGFSYVGGVTDAAGKIARDTRTDAQKAGMHSFLRDVVAAIPTIRTIKGHRDYSPDKNRNGLVEPSEWIKVCPCFDAIPEFAYILRR